MKKQFSTSWKGSIKPRKQRKYRAKAPIHVKRKMIASHLSKELRQKYGRRAIAVRKGDTVKIMVGTNTGKTGKIERIDSKTMKLYIEGIQITKKDGSKVSVPINYSNLLVTSLNMDDKERVNSVVNKNKKAEEKKLEAKK
jgi:large subunit ribosomal protein L24